MNFCAVGERERIPTCAWRILNSPIVKGNLVELFRIVLNPFNCLQNVSQITEKTDRICFLHTGTASASTVSRKESGNAMGVTTSTGTPSNVFSS